MANPQGKNENIDYEGRRKSLYDAVSKKYNVGKFDDFDSYMKDDQKRMVMYDYLKKNSPKMPEWEEFNKEFGFSPVTTYGNEHATSNIYDAPSTNAEEQRKADAEYVKQHPVENQKQQPVNNNIDAANTQQPTDSLSSQPQDTVSVQQQPVDTTHTEIDPDTLSVPERVMYDWNKSLQEESDTLKAMYDNGIRTEEDRKAYNEKVDAFNKRIESNGYLNDNRLNEIVEGSKDYAPNGWTYNDLLKLGDLQQKAIEASTKRMKEASKKGLGPWAAEATMKDYSDAEKKFREEAKRITGLNSEDEAVAAIEMYNTDNEALKLSSEAGNLLGKAKAGLESSRKTEIESGQRRPNTYVTPQGISVTTYNTVLNGDLDSSKYLAATRMMEKSQQHIENYMTEKSQRGEDAISRFAKNTVKGFGQGMLDVSTWDFGLSDLETSNALLNAVEKFRNNEELSDADNTLLDAAATQMAVEGSLQLGLGFTAGKVTADAVPFIISMMVSPTAQVGNSVGSNVARWALRNGVSKIGARALGTAFQMVSNTARGAVMAFEPLQLANTISGIQREQVGDVYKEEDGTITVSKGKSAVEAFVRGGTKAMIENESEFSGDSLIDPMLNMISLSFKRSKAGKAIGRGVESLKNANAGTRMISDILSSLSNNKYWRVMNGLKERAHIEGLLTETLEEIWGGAENAILGNEGRLLSGINENGQYERGVFSLENFNETALTMLPMQVMFGAVGIGGYGIQKTDAIKKKNYAANTLQKVFGDKFDIYKTTIEAIPEENFGTDFAKILENENGLNERQKTALAQYAIAVQYNRGLDAAERQDRLHDVNKAVFGAAYDEGYAMTDMQQMKDAGTLLSYDVEQMQDNIVDWRASMNYFQLINNGQYSEAIEMMINNGESEDTVKLIENFISSKQRLDGALAKVDEKYDLAIQTQNDDIDSKKNQEDGNLYTVSDGNRNGYLTVGVVGEDGTMTGSGYVMWEGETTAQPVADGYKFAAHPIVTNAEEEKQVYAQQINDQREAEKNDIRGIVRLPQSVGEIVRYVCDDMTVTAINGDNYELTDSSGETYNVDSQMLQLSANHEARRTQGFEDYMTQRGVQQQPVQQPVQPVQNQPQQSVQQQPQQTSGTVQRSAEMQQLVDGGVLPIVGDNGNPRYVQLGNGVMNDGNGYLVEIYNNSDLSDAPQQSYMSEAQLEQLIAPKDNSQDIAEQQAYDEAQQAAAEQRADEEAKMAEEKRKVDEKNAESLLNMANDARFAVRAIAAVDKMIGEGYQLTPTQQVTYDTIKDELAANMDAANSAMNEQRADETPKDTKDVPDVTNDTAEDARARGFRMVNGEKINRHTSPIASAVTGKNVTVKFGNEQGDVVNGKYMVVEAKDVVPSHVGGVRNNEFFINEAQPKDRVDQASVTAMQQMANNINPEEITAGATAYTGAPVVNSRGEVLQGNNRSEALRNMNQDSRTRYKQYLTDHAADFGIDAAAIEGMHNPVLVRMVDVEDTEAIRLGQKKAQDTESGGEQTIDPKTTLEQLNAKEKTGTFVNILLNDGGNEEMSVAELIAANGVEALKWLNRGGFINDTQYQTATKNGVISGEAKAMFSQMISNMLFDGGSDSLPEKFKSLPVSAQRALSIVMTRDINVAPELSIKKYVQEAIECFYDAVQQGVSKHKDYKDAIKAMKTLNTQTDMFGSQKNYSIFAQEIAARIATDTQKTLTARLTQYYDLVTGKAENTLFEDAPTDKLPMNEAFAKAFGITLTNNEGENNENRQPTVRPVRTGSGEQREEGEQGRTGNTGGVGGNVSGGQSTTSGGTTEGTDTEGTGEVGNTGNKPKLKHLNDAKSKEEAKAYLEKKYGKDSPMVAKQLKFWELLQKKKNVGIANDPEQEAEDNIEIFKLGVEIGAEYVKEGYVKFKDWLNQMILDFGDAIREHAKKIYLGMQAELDDDTVDEMDDRKAVRAFDVENYEVEDNETEEENGEEDNTTVGTESGESGSTGMDGTDEGGVSGNEGNEPTDTGNTGTDTGNGTGSVGSEGSEGSNEGASGNNGNTHGGVSTTGGNTGKGSRGRSGNGQGGRTGSRGGRKTSGEHTGEGTEVTETGGNTAETNQQNETSQIEEQSYANTKERIKDVTDKEALKKERKEAQAVVKSENTTDNEKAEANGVIRAINERIKDILANEPKDKVDISKEKVDYRSVSDPEGIHSIGSVVPSGVADAMINAIKKVEEEEGMSIADFVCKELGYANNEEMFTNFSVGKRTGLSGEQVDSVGQAIHKMKNGGGFIIGDQTGVGKGRQAAALIRWGLKAGKKVLFVTQKPNLISTMYGDLRSIGSGDLYPLVINDGTDGDITEDDENKTIIYKNANPTLKKELYRSDSAELPTDKNGKKYDFVMMTYSQIAGSAGESDKAQSSKLKADWLKEYAKDGIVILDESHTASGESTTGKFFRDIVEQASGATFLSATYAKRPDNMLLYAIKSSLGQINMTKEDLFKAIEQYGVPMQEILSNGFFGSGEMVRRERDMSDVQTHWLEPTETFSEEEQKNMRKTSDTTMELLNELIDFQRSQIEPIVDKLEESFSDHNTQVAISGSGVMKHAMYVPVSAQTSNIMNMMVYGLKSKKAAELAIEQIKNGKKPVIAVDNTLGAYVDELPDGEDIYGADFAQIFERQLKKLPIYKVVSYAYDPKTKKWNKKVGEEVHDATIEDGISTGYISQKIEDFRNSKEKIEISISPIDQIMDAVRVAGYKIGEITGRNNKLVTNADGSVRREKNSIDKKRAISRFNGGSASKPIKEEDRLDALIINSAGATGNSMHSSKEFGDQKPRAMLILQPSKDINTEVQMRGRIDRTGQVHRGEYFYITSPIPAEQKIIMMLKQKLASLDANSVGTEEVSSNKVDSTDMDNKYGDEVARQLLEEDQNLNRRCEFLVKMNKAGEYVGHEGLLYDLLKKIQRLDCKTQERVLEDLMQRYTEQIEYLNQNNINDLKTATKKLDAETIDDAVMVKGKNNESENVFSHDTNIERVEANVLKKPMRSDDIRSKMRKLGSRNTEGDLNNEHYADVDTLMTSTVKVMENDLAEKHKAEEDKIMEQLKNTLPQNDKTDAEYKEFLRNWPALKRVIDANENERLRKTSEWSNQKMVVQEALGYLKPGRPYLVPVTDNVDDNAAMMYGRFIGFDAKDGKPRNIRAVFAVKDSRVQIDVPIISQYKIFDKIRNDSRYDLDLQSIASHNYGLGEKEGDEDYQVQLDEWWDRMIPKNVNRQIRYMITGNILQACGSLGKHKGQIVSFTRRDKGTGEITIEKGMLLAEDFDPENFRIKKKITKEDIWGNFKEHKDTDHNISVYRSGDMLVVKFGKWGSKSLKQHPINNDNKFQQLISGGLVNYKDRIEAYVNENKAEEVLDHLFNEYSYTADELFVMPDSTEKVDAIIPTNKSFSEVINEYSGEFGSSIYRVESAIKKMLKQYKMDVNNEDLKDRIRKAVQLRQAYLRKRYTQEDSNKLGWHAIIEMERVDRFTEQEEKEYREEAYNKLQAILEELNFRGITGTEKHFAQGEWSMQGAEEFFNSINKDEYNKGLFDRVSSILEGLNMNIILSEKINNDIGGQAAGNAIEYNWKYMNAKFVTDQSKSRTTLHEMIHTISSYIFHASAFDIEHVLPQEILDTANELKQIFSIIQYDDAFVTKTEEGSWTDYGVTNEHEMLAEMANPIFRDHLKKVKIAVKMKSGYLSFSKPSASVSGAKMVTAYDLIEERLNILIDGFDKKAWTEVYKGSKYGSYSYDANDTVPMSPEEITNNTTENIRYRRTYHGSAADFNKFDHSFMGTGEGNQIYGWGTYVSEVEGVAKTYADMSASTKNNAAAKEADDKYNQALSDFENKYQDKDGNTDWLAEGVDEAWENVQNLKKAFENAVSEKPNVEGNRHLYDVEIPDDNGSNYIDWDEKVSKDIQRKVEKALLDKLINDKESGWKESDRKNMHIDFGFDRDMTGGDLYGTLQNEMSDKEASMLLSSLGLVGIKVDTNRSDDSNNSESKNYVIFNEKDAKIVNHTRYRKRNGQFMRKEESDKIANAISETAQKLGSNVIVANDMQDVKDPNVRKMLSTGRGIAYYDVDNDQVVIYAPNIVDAEDAKRTVLHETLGHKGLRALIGADKYDAEMKVLFRQLPKEEMEKVVLKAMELMHENRKRTGYRHYLSEAMDEYLAEKAESYDVKNVKWWNKVIGAVKQMIRSLGIDVELTDSDITYLLWRSHVTMKNGEGVASWMFPLRDVKMQKKYGTGIFDPNRNPDDDPTDPNGGGRKLRWRKNGNSVQSISQQLYNEGVASTASRIEEAWVDGLRSLDLIEKAVTKESGKKLEDYQDVYLAMQHLSSINAPEQDKLERNYTQPLMDHYADMIRKYYTTEEELEKYMIAMHGQERNEKFAQRDARKQAEEEFAGQIAAARAAGDTALEAQLIADQAARETELYNTYREKDYAGLTQTFAEGMNPKPSVADLEQMAADYVTTYTANMEQEDIDKLWDLINKINQFTLKKSKDSGMMSRQTYSDVSNQFEHYVPLRGWDETTAMDTWNYLDDNNGRGKIEYSVRNAYGRESRAGNILATMIAMANHTIAIGNKNIAKQKLLNLAEGHKTKLISVNNMWYTRKYNANGATNVWEVAQSPMDATDAIFAGEPYYGKKYDELTQDERADMLDLWEQHMKQLQETGDAKRSRQGLSLDRPISDMAARQHEVRVMRNGLEYMVTINGAPNAAQAANGLLNLDANPGAATRVLMQGGRIMSRAYTSLSPEFMVRNFERDMNSAINFSAVKYGTEYAAKVTKNIAQLAPIFSFAGGKFKKGKNFKDNLRAFAGIGSLFNKWNHDQLDMNDETERLFKEFMDNGGKTGYSNIQDVEELAAQVTKAVDKATGKRKIDKFARVTHTGKVVNGVEKTFEMIEWLNTVVENTTRFAVYMASRNSGRSILKSVNDAKECSVNFNKKGSGALGNALFRSIFIFTNARIQGLMRYVNMLRGNEVMHNGELMKPEQRKRILLAMAMDISMGSLNAILGIMIASMYSGDDDDDEYYGNPYFGISKFKRLNQFNMMTPWGGSLAYNLGQEEAIFYGMGVLWAEAAMTGRGGNVVYETANQMMKLNPVGDIDPDRWNTTEGSVAKTLMESFIPSAAKPWYEALSTNTDFLGKRIAYKNSFNENKPEYERTRYNTPEYQKWMSKLAYAVSDGKANWNPNTVEHVVKGYMGGLYTFPIKIANAIDGMIKEGKPTVETLPVIDLYWNSYNQPWQEMRSAKEMFDYYKEDIDNLEMRINAAKRMSDTDPYKQFMERRIEEDNDKALYDLWEKKYKKNYSKYRTGRSKDEEKLNKLIYEFVKEADALD